MRVFFFFLKRGSVLFLCVRRSCRGSASWMLLFMGAKALHYIIQNEIAIIFADNYEFLARRSSEFQFRAVNGKRFQCDGTMRLPIFNTYLFVQIFVLNGTFRSCLCIVCILYNMFGLYVIRMGK